MTIKELLTKVPKHIDNDLEYLAGPYYNHLPEAFFGQGKHEGDIFPWWRFKEFPEIKNLVYGYRQEDCRRRHILAAIAFNDVPVMVYRAAGREGDDFNDRFIVNKESFRKMIKFIDSKYVVETKEIIENEKEFIDVEMDSTYITNFYYEEFYP